MSESPERTDFDPTYIAGLLDSIARVRFDLTEQPDGTFTVRPMLRIRPYGTEMRQAVVGEFLESEGYTYDYVARDYGAEFFRLQQRSDLEALRRYLEGESAHLVRELEFTTGLFSEEFDFEILEPEDAYRFILARDELRYGWRPRGRFHVPPEDLEEEYDVETEQIDPPSLPAGTLREDYAIEWIAGAFDGVCRYRPSIAENDEHEVGYGMYPVARLHRTGAHPRYVDHFVRFCEDYDLHYGDSSARSALNVTYSGSANIRRVLDILFPRLLVLAEHSAALVEDVLPRFDDGAHYEKQGFYELLRDFDPIAKASGGPFRGRKYDPEFFAERWQGEVELTAPESGTTEFGTEPPVPDLLERLADVSLDPSEYEGRIGRYQSIVDRKLRDSDRARDLRERYGDRCQVCGTRLASADGTGYAEIHHLKPLDEPHQGPDATSNMLVLCPTHHAEFDNGVLQIEPEEWTVSHPYDTDVDGAELTFEDDHRLDREVVVFHNETICAQRRTGP